MAHDDLHSKKLPFRKERAIESQSNKKVTPHLLDGKKGGGIGGPIPNGQ